MGGILIFLAALAAFVLGGALVLLISVYRRSEQHRRALLQAYARIDQLERTVSAITFGELAPAPGMRKVGASGAEPAAQAPSPLPAPAEAPAEAAPEPAPAEEPVAQAARETAESAASAVEEADADETVAARIARAETEAPIRLDIVAALTGVAALAALGTMRAGIMEPPVALAITAIAGAGAIGMAERRREDGAPAALLWLFGAILAMAGVAAARFTDAAVTPPIAALAGLSALGFAAFARAPLFGVWLVAFGVLAIQLAPLLALEGGVAAHARHAALALGGLAVLWIARERGEPRWGHVYFFGALAWAAYSAFTARELADAISVSALTALLSAQLLVHGWRQAQEPLRPIGNPRRRLALLAALLGMGGAGVMLALLATRGDAFAQVSSSALCAMLLMSAAAAALRQGFAPLPLGLAFVSALMIGVWPTDMIDPRWFGASAAGLAFCAAAGGGVMLWRRQDEGAALAGLGPLALLVAAQARAAPALEPWVWATAAAGLGAGAAACAFALRGATLARDLFAAGAVLALVAAPGFLALAPWPPVVVAFAIPFVASIGHRLQQPGFGHAACILSAFLLLQLLSPQLAAASAAMRVLVYLIAVGALFAAAYILAPDHASPESQAVLASALLAIAAATTLESHRAFATAQPAYQLLELGMHVLLWLGLAFALAWRFGARPRPLTYAIEAGAFAAAGLYALAAGVLVLNPWWGMSAAPAAGWDGFNLLLLAYLGPAACFIVYGRLRERQGLKFRAAASLALGMTLALLYVTLELRRAFHGPAMAAGPILPAEGWAYTVGWLGFAAALVLLALERTAAWLRHVAAALALAALAKAMLLDLQSFQGLGQIAMAGLLLGAGACVVLLYRRYALPGDAAAPKTNARAQQRTAQATETS